MKERKTPVKSMYTPMLADQKRTVKRAAIDWMSAAILFLILDIVVLIIALTLDDKEHADRILYIALPILSVICAAFLFVSVRRFLVVEAFNRIEKDNGEIIKVECKKVRFIIHPISRFLSGIIGIAFITADRQKYVYISTNMRSDSKTFREDVRRSFVGKTAEVVCYKDSHIIKDFDLDKTIC